ncbi:MAG: penicillin acylase family protein [Myxococcota bacterium]
MRLIPYPLALALALSSACSDDKTTPDTATTDAADTATSSDVPDAADGVDDASDGSTELPAIPDYFPDKANRAGENLDLPGLTDAVRVVYDDRGIPHIYGKNTNDVMYVQGYVTARDRIFQMHTLRSAAKGRLAEFAGNGSLSGDFFLRMLHLGKTAEEMAAATATNDAALSSAIDAYSLGVNTFLERMKAGTEKAPIEYTLFKDLYGADFIYPWTAADTMSIVRLQTWDLGFGGVIDELDLYTLIQTLREKYSGTKLEGIWLDAANFEPTAETATLEPDGGAKQVGSYDLAASLEKPVFNKKGRASWAKQVKAGFDAVKDIPHRAFRGAGGEPFGSNNWTISGALTASGKPIGSNDTHLSLRNPAVFYQVHLATTLAGGDLNVQGVMFAGAPGVVLGHNEHAAWGGTVFFSDVTDNYIETLDATKTHVTYDGAQVALVQRKETFHFAKPETGACIDVAPAWAKALTYTESVSGAVCTVEVTFLDVPHHGPIVPWSITPNDDGTFTAMSFAWTGFQPTDELGAVFRIDTVASFDGFKAALDRFGVGAQNWIYGDQSGDIGWYPSHLLPIRKNIAAGNYDYPPFLPMPGDTSDCAWDGFVPRSAIPQAKNPAKGYLVTANADPVGVSFDNDPFDDGDYYIGYAWDPGYRVDTITKRIQALVDAGHKITREDTIAIQADHKSRLGADLTPTILAAIDDALASDGDASAKPFANDGVVAARALLAKWGTDYDYQAESGVGEPAGSAKAEASAATAIFNAFLPFLVKNAMHDEGLDVLEFSQYGRFLKRLFQAPETMKSYDATNHVSPVWDDQSTPDTVETESLIIVKSLKQALDFLSDATKIGPKLNGGFGTSDMTLWRWGMLHTLTMKHNVSNAFDIPAPSEHANGFERHGDNYVVDASNPGFTDTNFTFSGGPAIRNHYEMKDPVEFQGVIPGGQSEQPTSAHYADEAEHWNKNESPKEYFTVEDVVGAKEKVVDFWKK